MRRPALCFRALIACLPLLLSVDAARAADWSDALQRAVEGIDRDSPGRLGLYVKRLNGGEAFSYGADRYWYLGSTAKVPIAIATLQTVDAGRLKLSDTRKLEPTDRIEAGQLVWRPVGTPMTIDFLLNRMLVDSDNTAATMLVRIVGEDRLNDSARAAMGADGVKRLTSLAQVRYDVYAEIHPDARKLTNDQLVRVASVPLGPQRVEAVRRALGVPASALQARTIDEAYARYYKQGANSATLVAYGGMLEKLVRGDLLSPQSTQRIFKDMKIDVFTNYRLQAGLPRSVRFIHKTGTQYRTACHSGVINPENGGRDAIVVVACAADLDEQKEAGKVFERVGRAITDNVLQAKAQRP
jgi:beta-lactamase class A